MSRPMYLNRPGPRASDIDRLVRLAEACDFRVDKDRASTGTVYVSILRYAEEDEAGNELAPELERVYRFGSHATAHQTEDYSVCSGGTEGRTRTVPGAMLPPGYHGWIDSAIIDFAERFGVTDQPAVRRALAAARRNVAIHG